MKWMVPSRSKKTVSFAIAFESYENLYYKALIRLISVREGLERIYSTYIMVLNYFPLIFFKPNKG